MCFKELKRWKKGSIKSTQTFQESNTIIFSIVPITIDEIAVQVNKIGDDSTYKAAYGGSLSVALYFNENNSKFKICKQVFMTIPMVMYSLQNFYLLDAMNDKIEVLKSAGLVDFWLSRDIYKNISRAREVIYPKVLSFLHLRGIFDILLIGFAISLIVFMFECRKFLCKNSIIDSENLKSSRSEFE